MAKSSDVPAEQAHRRKVLGGFPGRVTTLVGEGTIGTPLLEAGRSGCVFCFFGNKALNVNATKWKSPAARPAGGLPAVSAQWLRAMGLAARALTLGAQAAESPAGRAITDFADLYSEFTSHHASFLTEVSRGIHGTIAFRL